MRPVRWFPLLAALGCGRPDPCADVDLGDSGVGLVLSAETHPGWGREQCFDCHVVARIHPGGCLPEGVVDEAALERTEESCTTCHGNNGLAEEVQ